MESELKLVVPSCQLLLAVAMAADPACVQVVGEVVPVLVQRVSQSQPGQGKLLMELVANFAAVSRQFTVDDGMMSSMYPPPHVALPLGCHTRVATPPVPLQWPILWNPIRTSCYTPCCPPWVGTNWS